MIAAPMELGTQLERDITAELAGGADPTDAQFRLLVESVSDYAIYLLDTAGRVVSWNTGAERIKGCRADEIIGEHFSRFYLPEDRDRSKPQHDLDMAAAAGRTPTARAATISGHTGSRATGIAPPLSTSSSPPGWRQRCDLACAPPR